VSSFLHNLRSPVVMVNALLQGDFDHAGNTLLRFTVNSTFGFAGVADVAHDLGFPRRSEDFGQTLAVWGVGEGPYLMLPVLGPSNARDAVGRVVDYFTDPFAYFRYERFTYSRFAAKTVDTRVRNYDLLHDLENTSVDYYAAIRSLYRQNRRDAIDNGAEAELPPLPEMAADEDDLEDEEDVLLPTPRAR
jgi:phospholipid-binding lipoprotein MlaA